MYAISIISATTNIDFLLAVKNLYSFSGLFSSFFSLFFNLSYPIAIIVGKLANHVNHFNNINSTNFIV